MEIAFCTTDDRSYSAIEFSKLDRKDRTAKRRKLQCIECEAEAYYSKAAKGRTPFFGAKDHHLDCKLSRRDMSVGIGIDKELAVANRIIVDLGTIVSEGSNSQPSAHRNGATRNRILLTGKGTSSNVTVKRGVDSLLKALISTPDFHCSAQLVVVDGIEMKAREFFIPMSEVTIEHVGLVRGFWGNVVSGANGNGGLTWLNMHADHPTALYFSGDLFVEAQSRFEFTKETDLNAAAILYVGKFPIGQKARIRNFNCLAIHPIHSI